MKATQKLGIDGEAAVADYLKCRGFKVLHQNYRSRYGEIDLIAQKKELLVFVEVKARKKKYFAISSVVNYTKQQKISKTAQLFIVKHNIYDKVCRFDVASVLQDGDQLKIEYIENAFNAT